MADHTPTHPASDFDPLQVPIRKAVSVLMVRNTPHLELFVQHRVTTIDFAAGMVVYPGGRVDDADYHSPIAASASHAQKWARTWATDTPTINALLTAAVRETREETGATLDPTALHPWANWTTPPGPKRRFDTYFYVADAHNLAAQHQTTEATNSEWAPAHTLLADYNAHRLDMMRPTLHLLNEIIELGTVDAILEAAAHRSIDPVRPTTAAAKDLGKAR